MPRLGSRRAQTLAAYLCGDDSNDLFPYRRHVDLTDLFQDLAHAAPGWDDPGESRYRRASSFVAECNRTEFGKSGFPKGIEDLVAYLLDLGEFESAADRNSAVDLLRAVFDGYKVSLHVRDVAVSLVSTETNARQKIIDATFETAFGETLSDGDLRVARLHFQKARSFARGESPDYENAVKEAVSSIESYLKTLTGEKDFKKALAKATKVGVPKPLTVMIEKLYAWRGDEPGVGHAGISPPRVDRSDAEFACNQAMVINAYLREKLVTSPED